ncbi:MAG: S1C family serine protease [Gammaproteobacteria bacterium]
MPWFGSQRWPFLAAVALLPSLVPESLMAQPFDLERTRRGVVRVFGDSGNAVGSGLVVSVSTNRAYILTAYHVIKRDVERGVPAIQMEFFPDGTGEARISRERLDPTNDLAVLTVDKLPASTPVEIPWGSSSTLPETERVWALGHPFGGPGWVVSDGSVGRKTGARVYFSGTATDAGNSGGPLLDGKGAVVGVITSEGGSAGIAVEADIVRLIIRAWVPALPAVATPPPLTPGEQAPASAGRSPAQMPNISGVWRDPQQPGNGSQVTQDGNRFHFTRWGVLPNGIRFESSGSGTVTGQGFTSSYSARYQSGTTSTGNCSGTVSPDGTRIEMNCRDSLLGAFPLTSVRQ